MIRFSITVLCVTSLLGVLAVPIEKKSGIEPFGERIVNGEPAQPGQFPWQAAIYFTTLIRTSFCGGALIADQWILTAAHCVVDTVGFYIYLGTNSLTAYDPNRVIINATEYITYPDYDPATLHHDVGIIKLPEPVELNDYVKPIRMSYNYIGSYVQVTVSGFGKSSDAATGISNTLNYVQLTTISNYECQYYYGTDVLQEMVCAVGTSLESTCGGDSGGPLVRDPDTKPLHEGIATFVNDDGCETSYPSGYTRTGQYSDWIRAQAGIPLPLDVP